MANPDPMLTDVAEMIGLVASMCRPDYLPDCEQLAVAMCQRWSESYRSIKGNRQAGHRMNVQDMRLITAAALRICLEELEKAP